MTHSRNSNLQRQRFQYTRSPTRLTSSYPKNVVTEKRVHQVHHGPGRKSMCQIPLVLYSVGLQVADAPLARQSSAASGKPALWRRRAEPAPGANVIF